MGLRIIRDMFGPALLPCCSVMVAMDRLTHDRQWLVQLSTFLKGACMLMFIINAVLKVLGGEEWESENKTRTNARLLAIYANSSHAALVAFSDILITVVAFQNRVLPLRLPGIP